MLQNFIYVKCIFNDFKNFWDITNVESSYTSGQQKFQDFPEPHFIKMKIWNT